LLPSALAWIRIDGHRLDAALRRRLFALYRPPQWLPCWFHGLWYLLVSRFARLHVVIGFEGDCRRVAELCRSHGAHLSHELAGVGCLCATVDPRVLQHLCCCDGVTRIWADTEVRAMLDAAVPSAGAVQAVSRYSGQGVTIAVVDTGIYPHPDLSSRIIAFHDAVGKRTSAYDDNGHGTHVAGCAAGDGTRSRGQYRGPAAGALLVGVKVLNKTGSGTMSHLLDGIDWVIQNRERYHIRIMSMSLGGTARGRCSEDPLCQAVGRAWDAGIVCVVAAGNEGPGGGTVATPGISPKIITVGAMDDHSSPDRRDDTLASFSSRGPTPEGEHKPDVLAPGVNITALRSPRSYVDKSNPDSRVGEWYATLSGTSMATPLVSGLVALLLEAEPGLTPNAVKARLRLTADNWILGPDEQGAGYINADRMLGL